MSNEFRTRIKFCGFTHLADAQAAIRLGVDAIGFVFYEKSKRNITLEDAKTIRAQLPPFVSIVALVVDAEPDFVRKLIVEVQPTLIQFHGNETDAFCQQFNIPYIKALRVESKHQLEKDIIQFPNAKALLLDAYVPNQPGGTGTQFNWSWIPSQCTQPIVLAGGLTSDNVTSAILQTQPFAVDVSGGIEDQPGKKSLHKMEAFVNAVAKADGQS